MTECGGGSHVTRIHDLANGHVGGPVSPIKIKLVDVPELNYTSKTKTGDQITPCGEICMKGPAVFPGYFRDPENTKKMIDEDGWLHSGDVGMVYGDHLKFKIIDRVKEIFKLVQGEYIAPSKLESVYGKSDYVGQICVYGQSVKSYVIAIICPKKHNVITFLKEKDILKDGEEVESHYTNPVLLEEVKKSLDKLAAANNFNSLEKIGKVILSPIDFSTDNELLTPTQKLVRRKVETYFKKDIEQIYV